MTKHDFIFSGRRQHYIARHVAFWVVWCLAFNLLFHFPIHVFKGWDLSGPGTRNYQLLGPVLFFVKALIVNSFLGVIVPQIVLTYVLIYWLLPNYYYQRKNAFVVLAISAGLLLMFYCLAIGFKLSSAFYNRIAGVGGAPMPFPAFLQVVMIDQLGSLPIVLSFALMIKLVKRWWLKQKETELLAKEKIKAELQLLKAQVHPHFLFNTLNNIYFFTLTNSAQAPVMIRKLTGLLNYILHECDHPLVPLNKEIKMIRDYMSLEKIRYAEQMQMTIDVEGDAEGKMIAPLLLIPFVENSFKHGASKMITQPWVSLNIKIENNRLHFIIRNSQPINNNVIAAKTNQPNKPGNIGLKNVRKRLELLYPGIHELNIDSEPDSYTVQLSLQLVDMGDHVTIGGEIKPLNEYAMA